jgi:ketosteroid isomerase-like protein
MTQIPVTAALRRSLLLCAAIAAAPLQAAEPQARESQAAKSTAQDDERCAVWARELGFAQSVADHDAKAFAEHLHSNAVFGVGSKPTRGRDAITREWAGIIDGSAVKLAWYPAIVTVGGDGATAYSSGPALFEDPKTGATSLSRFGSVWQRGADGVWRVIFDDGTRPAPADAAAVKAFHDGRRTECPAA